MNAKTKTNNRLWQARKKLGLEQKQVAYLLGHKTISQISCYERGERLPNLKNALKLELILRVPVGDLFPEQYQTCRAEITARFARITLPKTYTGEAENPKDAHFCTYGNAVLQKKPTAQEIDIAKNHTMKLMRELGDVIRRRQ